jgi:acyl dehydratase
MYFEEFNVGQVFRVEGVKIDKEKIFAFAREYDPLPIHLDEEYAKNTCFGRLIAPGIMSFMLVWTEYVKMNIWTDALVAGKRTSITWLSPVYSGDTLRGVSTVTGKRPGKNNKGTLEIKVEVYNQNDVLVISDTSELVVRCRDKTEPDNIT